MGSNLFKCLRIDACVAFQSMMQGATMLGKGWRIKNDKVVRSICINVFQKFESVLAESLVTLITREVQFHITTRQFYRLCRTVNRVNQFGSSTHRIERKTSCVAEHIQHPSPLCVVLKKRTVVALVDEEACLLASLPVNVESQPVFERSILLAATDDEAVFWFHKG